MIILGIDPGSRTTGYGLIRQANGKTLHVENGVINCEKAPTFNDRLVLIFNDIQALIRKFNPEAVSIENIFYSKNVKSTLKLGHARGSALLASALLSIPVFEYTPLEVKQAIVGYGGATKDQVQKMVKSILGLPQVAEENASDALAVAICHAHSAKMRAITESVKRKTQNHSEKFKVLNF